VALRKASRAVLGLGGVFLWRTSKRGACCADANLLTTSNLSAFARLQPSSCQTLSSRRLPLLHTLTQALSALYLSNAPVVFARADANSSSVADDDHRIAHAAALARVADATLALRWRIISNAVATHAGVGAFLRLLWTRFAIAETSVCT